MWKTVLTSIVLLINTNLAQAEIFMEASSGAYLGTTSLSLGYKTNQWNFLLGVGDTGRGDFEQINALSRYETWIIPWRDIVIKPMNIGFGALYTTNSQFSINNKRSYPEENYYDASAIRFVALYQGEIIFRNWSAFYLLTLLDQGLLVEFNNKGYGLNFISSGFGIKYSF